MRSSILLLGVVSIALGLGAVQLVRTGHLDPRAFAGASIPMVDRTHETTTGGAIMVVLLEHPDQIATLKRHLPPDAVVAATSEMIALRSGRIFALDVRAASEPLNTLGWSNRPLDIVTRGGLGASPAVGTATAAAAAGPSGGDDPLLSLAGKETLSPGEAMAIIDRLGNETPYATRSD